MILVEFFDFSPIDNLLAALSLNPEKIVMVTDNEKFSQRRLWEFERFLTLFKNTIDLEIRPYKSGDPANIQMVCQGILEDYQSPYFDLTGGGELVASMVTLWASQCKEEVTLFYIDAEGERIIPITGSDLTTYAIQLPALNVPQVIALSGGTFKRCDHLQPKLKDKQLINMILKTFDIFLKNQNKWHNLSGYMQQAKRYVKPKSDPPRIHCENRFGSSSGRGNIQIPSYILQQLSQGGIIKDLVLSDKHTAFTVIREELIGLLAMHGSFLEQFCYIEAAQSGYFDDVRGSVVIDGDGELQDFAEMQNEIDLICTKGITALFISCKSSTPSPLALSEIKLLSARFGGEYAKAIMVTSADIYGENPSLHKRAIELGIELIDRTQLNHEDFMARLKHMIED